MKTSPTSSVIEQMNETGNARRKHAKIRENTPNPSPMQATDQECRPSNSLLVTHMLTIAHRSEDRTHKKRREERHVKPRL